MAIEVPRRSVLALIDVATRLIDSRKPGSELVPLARELYLGWFDVCMRRGLDRVLAELDAADRFALADDDARVAALVAGIEAIDLDGGGPRNVRPRQLAECVVAALGLAEVDDPAPAVSLGADVRAELDAAIARVVDAELAGTKLREAVIAEARTRCEERFQAAFAKLAVHLDDHGQKLLKLPKVPIDALHASQRALSDARVAVVDRVGGTAIDRARDALARADAAMAERIDRPITLRLTPREVAIARAHAAATPGEIARALAEGLCDVLPIVWRAAERPVIPYSPTRTVAVGDVIDHPKFGRGTVVAALAKHIDVEFADAKRTLAYVPPRR
ncbi:MAG TPA: hypothetical protein VLX92_15730 [Kofleriaceae bacterium]|nr:hypothetical protein [Kofleriaceae bacterium]